MEVVDLRGKDMVDLLGKDMVDLRCKDIRDLSNVVNLCRNDVLRTWKSDQIPCTHMGNLPG